MEVHCHNLHTTTTTTTTTTTKEKYFCLTLITYIFQNITTCVKNMDITNSASAV